VQVAEEKQGFWSTLPGQLTALTGLIGAITGAVLVYRDWPTPNPAKPTDMRKTAERPPSLQEAVTAARVLTARAGFPQQIRAEKARIVTAYFLHENRSTPDVEKSSALGLSLSYDFELKPDGILLGVDASSTARRVIPVSDQWLRQFIGKCPRSPKGFQVMLAVETAALEEEQLGDIDLVASELRQLTARLNRVSEVVWPKKGDCEAVITIVQDKRVPEGHVTLQWSIELV
jgi:hypothetical protein